MTSPPQVVIDAVNAPVTTVTRRVEIYERDGATRWAKDTSIRLTAGSVTVDYTRDERRNLDLTIDNSDHQILTAPGELWYDKIIKTYRGVVVNERNRPPRVLIISGTVDEVGAFSAALTESGFYDIRQNQSVVTLADLGDAEIIVSLGGASAFTDASLIASAYAAGKTIFTQGQATQKSSLPFVTTDNSVTLDTWNIMPNTSLPLQLTSGWFPEVLPGGAGYVASAIDSTAFSVSTVGIDSDNDGTVDFVGYTIIAAVNANNLGGKWIHFQPDMNFSENFIGFLRSAFSWLNPFVPIGTYEVQTGEFMIDKINAPNFPSQIQITGRDYTKKCINSEFEEATQFTGPNSLEGLVGSIAAVAGITKMNLPVTEISVTQSFTYDTGATRFSAMKEIANAYNYDVFFDPQGYLRLQIFEDPEAAVPVLTLQTGRNGNLATYEKTTDDSRLYNHVLVVGTSPDGTSLPPSAEAKNTNPTSPTSIDAIGDRLYQYDSDFITTDDQAQAVADSFLAIHSLEEFALNFDSLMYFWLDVGNIISWNDPHPSPGDPNAFLLQTLTLPMDLGPMSGTGARLTIVQ